MQGRLTSITRYAVKGLSGETLDLADLASGHGIEDDRRYALALPGTVFDEAAPLPLPKTKFAVLAGHERMAALASRYEPKAARLHLDLPEGETVAGDLGDAAGRGRIEQAITAFMGEDLGGRPRLVAAKGHRFTDVSVVSPAMMEAVSLINLASVEALAQALGQPVDPRRFRGNLLVDGIEPWAELDWVDRTVTIGPVRFKGAKRTKRCAATEVNPDTAERDIRLPLELRRRYGHADMGIYLYVESDGRIQAGDTVRLAD